MLIRSISCRKLFLIIVVILISILTIYEGNKGTWHHATLGVIKFSEEFLILFNKYNGRYPTTNEGLYVLLRKPEGVDNWSGPYLPMEQLPLDGWGNEFIYIYPPKYGTGVFDLYSIGRDGIDNHGNGDDINNWVGYNEWIYERDRKLCTITARVLFYLLMIALMHRTRWAKYLIAWIRNLFARS